ncbi:MAG: RHS repeat-associated core domain-containing protein [Pseudomonadota bacterium]
MNIQQTLLAMVMAACLSAPVFAQQTTTYTYDANGNKLSEDGPRDDVSDITRYTYDASGNRRTVTNALGHQTQLLDYNGRGQAQRIIDANGTETLLTYHVRGWLESVTVLDPAGNPALNSVTEYAYDKVGQITQVTLPNGVVLNYQYDAARRLTQISNSLGERIRYTLDNAGNRIQEQILDNGGGISYTVSRAYDELSRVMDIIGAEGQLTHLDYDVNSNTTAITDPKAHTTGQGYDPLDRLRHTTDPNGGITQFSYDEQDRLSTVTDANGNTTGYRYDAFDNLTQVDSPDTGLTTHQYDQANNRIRSLDSRGVATHYRYDALNRLSAVTFPASPAENITYTYDQTDSAGYGIGRLTRVQDQSGTTRYTYDHRGNLTQKVTVLNGQAYTTQYRYDLANNPVTITYPSGVIVSISYDDQGRLYAMDYRQPGGDATPLINSTTYLPFGPATRMRYGNGLLSIMDYDQDYRLTRLSTGSVLDMRYEYDANGNITAIDHLQQAANKRFDYDALNRLDSAQGDYGAIDYTYDPVGNRLSRDQQGSGRTQADRYHYLLGSNQLNDIDSVFSTNNNSNSSNKNYIHDSNGNPIQIGSGPAQTDYHYNHANRLSTVTTATSTVDYRYNALGQRTQKTVTTGGNSVTTYYIYNELGQLLTELNGNGDITRDYIYANGQLLATLVTTLPNAGGGDAFYLVNKASGLKLRPADGSDGSPIIATQASNTSDWVRFRKVMRSDGYFYLQNLHTGMYFRPTSNSDGSGLEQRPSSYSGVRTQWSLSTADSDHHHLVSRWTGKYIRPNSGRANSPVVQQPNTWTGDWTRWQLESIPTVAEPTTTLYYVHNDHLGTPRVLTDQDQTIAWAASYTPFGEATISTEVVENNVRFPGQYFDGETNLHYNYYRYYDPATGRYITPDPIGTMEDYSDPQLQAAISLGVVDENIRSGLNHLYGYAEQNPTLWFDFYGLRNQGGGTRSSGSRSTAGQNLTCEQKCYKDAIRSTIAEGFLGLTPVSRAATLLSKAGGLASFGGFNALSTAQCIVKCQCKAK